MVTVIRCYMQTTYAITQCIQFDYNILSSYYYYIK